MLYLVPGCPQASPPTAASIIRSLLISGTRKAGPSSFACTAHVASPDSSQPWSPQGPRRLLRRQLVVNQVRRQLVVNQVRRQLVVNQVGWGPRTGQCP